MNYLIFDTETSGLARFDLPPDDPIQPRLLSIACLILNENLNEKSSFYALVHPGKQIFIDPNATKANGIMWEDIDKFGVPVNVALGLFNLFAAQVDLVVAHNIKFDSFIIDIELANQMVGDFRYDWKEQTYCTMLQMTDICKLPGKRGYKWPKLREAFAHCFPERGTFNEHHAMEDVRACADIFRWLKNREKKMEVINEAIAAAPVS
jgi:DNA polymerase III epsilon subunit-like protein